MVKVKPLRHNLIINFYLHLCIFVNLISRQVTFILSRNKKAGGSSFVENVFLLARPCFHGLNPVSAVCKLKSKLC